MVWRMFFLSAQTSESKNNNNIEKRRMDKREKTMEWKGRLGSPGLAQQKRGVVHIANFDTLWQ